MKNKISITLCDREYNLLSDETEEYLKGLAVEVNSLIEEYSYKNIRTSKTDAAALTCLDLIDKNRKLTIASENMRGQISMYIEEIAELNKQLTKLGHMKAVNN
ncbi:hypothetical protein FACS1894105_10340 [Clostridia bacterium]|nr:hypothetical protein FACS1894105_10340 [Clostridia bacterium]